MAADPVLELPDLGLCSPQFAQLRRIQVQDALVVRDDLIVFRLDAREHLILRFDQPPPGLECRLEVCDLLRQTAALLLRRRIIAGIRPRGAQTRVLHCEERHLRLELSNHGPKMFHFIVGGTKCRRIACCEERLIAP
jgi:hypothetical protein